MNTAAPSHILTNLARLDFGADPAPGHIAVVIHSCHIHADDSLLIELQYEIDHYSARPLRVILAAAADRGYRRLVLDTSRVTFCDSAFLGVLLSWQREGRTLQITRPSPAVNRLLDATPVGPTLRRCATTEEAPM